MLRPHIADPSAQAAQPLVIEYLWYPQCLQVQHRWSKGFKMDATDGVEDFRKQNMYWHLFDWSVSLGANFENFLKGPSKIIPGL